jgi:hypothetical protein
MKPLVTLHPGAVSDHSPLFCSGSTTVVSSSFPPAESGRCSSVEDLAPAQKISALALRIEGWALPPLFRESLLPWTRPWSGMSIDLSMEFWSPAS